MTQEKKPFDKDKAQAFTLRVVSDLGAAVHGAMNYLGDKLGIFKAMADSNPVSLDELALKTQLNPRYLREWLGSMVAAEYVDNDPKKGLKVTVANLEHLRGRAFVSAELSVKPSHLRFPLW